MFLTNRGLTTRPQSRVLGIALSVGLLLTMVPSVLAASLYFSPDNVSVANGQITPVQVMVDTSGQAVGGVGAKIQFDPNDLSISNIEAGSIFADYPVVAFDNANGTAVISGIVSDNNSLFSGQGVFAVISWQPKRQGSSRVTFQFEPNNTRDSNIAVSTGNGDILSEVHPLNFNVTAGPTPQQTITTTFGGQQQTTTTTTTPRTLPQRVATTWNNIIRGPNSGTPEVVELEPYETISQLPPKTTLTTSTPEPAPAATNAVTYQTRQLGWGVIIGLIGLLLIAGIGIGLMLSGRRRKEPPHTPHQPHQPHQPPHQPQPQPQQPPQSNQHGLY